MKREIFLNRQITAFTLIELLVVIAIIAILAAPATGTPCVSLGTNFPPNNLSVGWMDNMHSRMGNVGLADGSVQEFSRYTLQAALQNTGDAGQAMNPGPFVEAPGCSPAGINRIQLP
jgi:prepilin-type N-terminal cleavage/methylation domain-containing protein/prepilin-type processing-associated H-X9-DG protein